MKIMFTYKPNLGWGGGGCYYVDYMCKFLKNKGYEDITFVLEPNIDFILIIDPRKGRNKRYTIDNIRNYKSKNPKTTIIHIVNECDIKRKVSINVEPILLKTMKMSDHVVFISKWLQNYFINKYKLKLKSYSCIRNGCDSEFFYPKSNEFKKGGKIRLITHHWSDNYLKGFHIYNALDRLLSKRKDIEFTYVGRYNKEYTPKNINLIKPTTGKKLADIIRNHDIYLTASQNEPGGMHQVEGLRCGLPIVYCKGGGGIKEVCKGCGEEFKDINTMLLSIEKIKNNYDKYVERIDYDYLGSDRCCQEYLDLMLSLVSSK